MPAATPSQDLALNPSRIWCHTKERSGRFGSLVPRQLGWRRDASGRCRRHALRIASPAVRSPAAPGPPMPGKDHTPRCSTASLRQPRSRCPKSLRP